MSNAGIPREVKDFLSKYINSIEQLEILLLMFRSPSKIWQPEEIAETLGIQLQTAEKAVNHLYDRGLIQTCSSDMGCQAAGGKDELLHHVQMVAKTYAERRVNMINFIFSRHLDRIRAFADSFKLKG